MKQRHPSGPGGRGPRVRPASRFTLDEANRALPLVRRITQDIVSRFQTLQQQHALRRDQQARGNTASVAALDRRAAVIVQQIHGLIAELTALGCHLRDWEHGNVDFPALLDGRHVFLCWQLGEAHVRYWHELNAGLCQRQAIRADRNTAHRQRKQVRLP